jgi:hypothetical protein
MRKRRMFAAVVGVLVLMLAGGCGGGIGESGADPEGEPSGFVVRGTVSVPSYGGSNGTSCTVKDGCEDLRSGATVAITDAAGDVVAVGALVDSEATQRTCRFAFDVPGVPEGSSTYGIEVGEQAMVMYPRSRLNKSLDLTVQ